MTETATCVEEREVLASLRSPAGGEAKPGGARPRRLFVRSAGGLTGLDIHCGVWRALERAGIASDGCAGTSAGAIVSGMDAAGVSARWACDYLGELRDEDVRAERPLWKVRIPWIDWFLDLGPIERILRRLLPGTFEACAKRLTTYATDARNGHALELPTARRCTPLGAVLASMAISGVFPRVAIGEQEFCDGGTGAYLPLPRDWDGYDEVWLIVARTRPEEYPKRRGLLYNLLLNASWMMQNQVMTTVARMVGTGKATVLWPDVHTSVGMLRFDHGLIGQADEWTRKWLAERETAEGRG